MNAKRVFSLLLVFFTFFISAINTHAEEVQIPAPVGDIYVQDFANVLNQTERTELINLGRNIEDQTTAQIAVLTVSTIGDRPMEEFANAAFRQYGIGNKEKNNGVLLVLSLQERKVRIEVGYGLEGRIPDGKSGRILDEYAFPYLKNQQPNTAIVETYKALAKEVLAEYGNEGDVGKQTQAAGEKGLGIPGWLMVIVIIGVVFLDFKFFGGTLTYLLLSIISRGGGRGGGGGSRGGGGGSSGGGGAGRGW
ncbi:TPM domain-containing protein [Neobacillus drentensis]|uniref:TPM domain-containing protein n=1 Tax=Neobacillus drentensis TaxID=220684 RepID=UPI0008259D7F|nr:TPM domain-containing protein [Neobacillus drentensis]